MSGSVGPTLAYDEMVTYSTGPTEDRLLEGLMEDRPVEVEDSPTPAREEGWTASTGEESPQR